MTGRATLYAKSALCSALCRLHGFHSGQVACEGKLPVLYGGGHVIIRGRLAVRGRVAPCEIGAWHGGELRIGERVFINQGASVVASHHIDIGDDVRIGDFAAIYDSDYHAVEEGRPVRTAPVRVGANAWLGRGAVVLPGCDIGAHAVVAAGAVVTGDVPPRSLVAGNPARIVRELRAGDGWRRG